MSDEETFPWIPRLDRRSGIVRVSPKIMRLLKIDKKNKEEAFDVTIRRRKI